MMSSVSGAKASSKDSPPSVALATATNTITARVLMMMLMILPTAAPDPALHQGDWKERLERFNAASEESEDEVRIRGIPRKPCALLCEG